MGIFLFRRKDRCFAFFPIRKPCRTDRTADILIQYTIKVRFTKLFERTFLKIYR